MIIQNCYGLLCELGHIEDQIRNLKNKLKENGVELQDEALLAQLIKNQIKKTS